ncbi:MAG: YceI family protein, partial [Caulobacter sp.]|nr:YceI family protein [Caulobacter sp.]
MFVQIPPPAAVAPSAWACEARGPIASPAALKPGLYRLDPRRTRVSFKVSRIGPTSIRGVFQDASGALTVRDHDPTLIELNVSLPVARVKASSASATAALKSAAMLDSVTYPTIGFQSTRVVVTGA